MGRDVSQPPTATQSHSISTTAEPIVAMKRTPCCDPSDGASTVGADVTVRGVEVITNGAEVIAGPDGATGTGAEVTMGA
jgi:hypothetical protein